MTSEPIPTPDHSISPDEVLFTVDMHWGLQPVRLTGFRCTDLPTDSITTSVHIAAFLGEKLLVVRDRKGSYGFPGGRLENGETYHEALIREVYEEARAQLKPDFQLYAAIKIEYTQHLAGRNYPRDFTYMGMYAGAVRCLEPIGIDPAGIITARDLFRSAECRSQLLKHDVVLLQEALVTLTQQGDTHQRVLRAFAELHPAAVRLPEAKS